MFSSCCHIAKVCDWVSLTIQLIPISKLFNSCIFAHVSLLIFSEDIRIIFSAGHGHPNNINHRSDVLVLVNSLPEISDKNFYSFFFRNFDDLL